MATTKRDFEAVASIIARAFERCRTDEDEAVLIDVAGDLADYFGGQNERFKRAQFLEACGVEETA